MTVVKWAERNIPNVTTLATKVSTSGVEHVGPEENLHFGQCVDCYFVAFQWLTQGISMI